jgi:hypothetical protein
MEKLFVPKAQSIQLRELGFDEPCLAFYNGKFLDLDVWDWDYPVGEKRKEIGECPQAPTFTQAFRWFREKYRLFVQPNRTVDSEGIWYYFSISSKRTDVCEGSFIYEEAELACLKRLILIVNNL